MVCISLTSVSSTMLCIHNGNDYGIPVVICSSGDVPFLRTCMSVAQGGHAGIKWLLLCTNMFACMVYVLDVA